MCKTVNGSTPLFGFTDFLIRFCVEVIVAGRLIHYQQTGLSLYIVQHKFSFHLFRLGWFKFVMVSALKEILFALLFAG